MAIQVTALRDSFERYKKDIDDVTNALFVQWCKYIVYFIYDKVKREDPEGFITFAPYAVTSSLNSFPLPANFLDIKQGKCGFYEVTEPTFDSDTSLVGKWKLNEGAGIIAYDATDNGNDGSITGADFAAGKNGVGLDFNTGDYVNIPDDTAIQNVFDGGGSSNLTVNLVGDGENDLGNILSKNGWSARVEQDNGSYVKFTLTQAFSGANGIWTMPGAAIPNNTLTSLGVSYNNSDVANDPIFYLNGVPTTVSEAQTPVGTRLTDVGDDLYIGNNTDNNRATDGVINDVGLYGAILTASQHYALARHQLNASGYATNQNKLAETSFNSTDEGYYLDRDNIFFTGIDGKTFLLKYIPAPPTLSATDLTDYFTLDKTATGRMIVEDRHEEYLLRALDVFYEDWEEDVGRESIADFKLVRALGEVLSSRRRTPAVHYLDDFNNAA